MTYQKVLKHIDAIKQGQKETIIAHHLGQPVKQKNNCWTYNFTRLSGFPKLPPKNGSQVLLGASLTFRNHMVSNIKTFWFDK